jgi:hypothetical protein
MPFNRDLIESGCALKTFDGDLSVLELAIDFTVTKSAISLQKSETAFVAPVTKQISTVTLPREKRHIKEVVYGDNLDELSSTPVQEAQAVSHPVSKPVVEIPAVASGFCFRHTVGDTEPAINSTVSTMSDRLHCIKFRDLTTYNEAAMVAPMSKHLSSVTECMPRQKRHIKEIVYGDNLETSPSTPMQEAQAVSHTVPEQVVEIPAEASGFCFKHIAEDLSTDSVSHARIAVKALVSEVSHHTHWRSAIHGF